MVKPVPMDIGNLGNFGNEGLPEVSANQCGLRNSPEDVVIDAVGNS